MIECWFTEDGYRIDGPNVQAYTTINPSDDEYTTRWYVFMSMLQTLLSNGRITDEVRIYHDSRIVEELNGDLKPTTEYANDCRAYYMSHDRPMMRLVYINKTSRNVINKALISDKAGSPET